MYACVSVKMFYVYVCRKNFLIHIYVKKGKRLMGFKFRQIDVPRCINEKQKKMCM